LILVSGRLWGPLVTGAVHSAAMDTTNEAKGRQLPPMRVIRYPDGSITIAPAAWGTWQQGVAVDSRAERWLTAFLDAPVDAPDDEPTLFDQP